MGFGDRSDSFDLNVALQDHFKWMKKEEEAEKEKEEGRPNLDLGFKDGETIKINMKITVSILFLCSYYVVCKQLTLRLWATFTAVILFHYSGQTKVHGKKVRTLI